MTSRIPQRYVGLWRRRLLEAPGLHDDRSEVYWLQTPTLYVDLRISSDASSTAVQGFAGALQVEDNILTWHRWVDLMPAQPWPDVGRMEGAGDVLEEFGVYQPYREIWERVGSAADGRAWVWSGDGNDCGIWVMLGRYFMLALFRESEMGPEISYGLLGDGFHHMTILRSNQPRLMGSCLSERFRLDQDVHNGKLHMHDLEGHHTLTWQLYG